MAQLVKAYEDSEVTLTIILLATGHEVSSAHSQPCQWTDSHKWGLGMRASVADEGAYCSCVCDTVREHTPPVRLLSPGILREAKIMEDVLTCLLSEA